MTQISIFNGRSGGAGWYHSSQNSVGLVLNSGYHSFAYDLVDSSLEIIADTIYDSFGNNIAHLGHLLNIQRWISCCCRHHYKFCRPRNCSYWQSNVNIFFFSTGWWSLYSIDEIENSPTMTHLYPYQTIPLVVILGKSFVTTYNC